MDQGRAQELLTRERARIEGQLRVFRTEEVGREDEDTIGPGDPAEDLFEAGRDEALRERLEVELEAVERAERRLAEGTYGLSVLSGQPIPDARLEAVPWAERTVAEEEPGP
jgi:DnaK suppressor protein